jgi:uncharacterized protein
MTTIGLLSDTHGYIHPRVFDFFTPCDEIWHAGDIGSIEVCDKLAAFKPFRAVHGNIDDNKIRSIHPETLHFQIEDLKVMITHIGGYPGKYSGGIKKLIQLHKPKLFIAGHSHILKVIPDPSMNLLFINPGAAGIQGFHHKITFMRFKITDDNIHDLEIMEIDRNTILAKSID